MPTPDATTQPEKPADEDDDLLRSVQALRQARDRDKSTSDDGGGTGRSDNNDTNVG